MSDAEHKLLIWCGLMLVRGAPLTPAEADEIDQLIADVRRMSPPARMSEATDRDREKATAFFAVPNGRDGRDIEYLACLFAAARQEERARCAAKARARSNYSGLHPFKDTAYLIAADIERGD